MECRECASEIRASVRVIALSKSGLEVDRRICPEKLMARDPKSLLMS